MTKPVYTDKTKRLPAPPENIKAGLTCENCIAWGKDHHGPYCQRTPRDIPVRLEVNNIPCQGMMIEIDQPGDIPDVPTTLAMPFKGMVLAASTTQTQGHAESIGKLYTPEHQQKRQADGLLDAYVRKAIQQGVRGTPLYGLCRQLKSIGLSEVEAMSIARKYVHRVNAAVPKNHAYTETEARGQVQRAYRARTLSPPATRMPWP